MKHTRMKHARMKHTSVKKITILGAGAWGTAIAALLAQNGHQIKLWCFEQDVADCILQNRINKTYLPEIKLSQDISATSNLKDALDGAEIIFEAIPVLFLRKVLTQAKEYVSKEQSWVCLSKGIESKTLFLPSQIIKDVFDFDVRVAVLSGPNFAQQLAKKEQTASVIASHDKDFAKLIAQLCDTTYFKPYISSDIIGTQVCGALKNVISLFLGIIEGSEYNENTRAFLFTRGFCEMMKITKHFGGDTKTVCGLSGFGDLLLGFLGEKNRNYELGILFGQEKVLPEGKVFPMGKVLPEGINTVKSIAQLIERDSLKLPICSATYEVIFENKSIKSFVDELMKEDICEE